MLNTNQMAEFVSQGVLTFPKIVSSTGSLLSKTDQGWKDNLARIKAGSGRGNTIKTQEKL